MAKLRTFNAASTSDFKTYKTKHKPSCKHKTRPEFQPSYLMMGTIWIVSQTSPSKKLGKKEYILSIQRPKKFYLTTKIISDIFLI